jgi:hypothetical protein
MNIVLRFLLSKSTGRHLSKLGCLFILQLCNICFNMAVRHAYRIKIIQKLETDSMLHGRWVVAHNGGLINMYYRTNAFVNQMQK